MIPHGSATRSWWLCVSDSVALKRRNNHREEKNAIKTVEALELEGLTEGRAREESLEKLNGYLDELEWLEVIIVHIETPTVKIPDNTDTINELLGD